MNHKRGRSKNQRAGCLMCKPHKANGARGLKRKKIQKAGFGVIRGAASQLSDLENEK